MYAFMPCHTESSSSSAPLKSFKLANSWLACGHAKSFSCVQLFETLWTVACQAPPGAPPDPEFELTSLRSPALAGGFFTTDATWGAQVAT